MQTLIVRYRKKERKANHIRYLRYTLSNLHNEIIQNVLEGVVHNEFTINLDSNVANKARLLKKYNRRLKWLLY